MINTYSLYPLGDKGVTIIFGDNINVQIHRKVKTALQRFEKEKNETILDIVPTYNTITIYYDWLKTSYNELEIWVNECLSNDYPEEQVLDDTVIEIPICYGNGLGPDLSRVAEHNQISEEEVIRKHSSECYLIYMMGFLPGFPYLGSLPNDLATPRLESPRGMVEAGSVGIAGDQTGIYSIASPGGWNIIGQTPVGIYHPKKKQPFSLAVGNFIKFKPINKVEFDRIRESEMTVSNNR